VFGFFRGHRLLRVTLYNTMSIKRKRLDLIVRVLELQDLLSNAAKRCSKE
jgi:hypothetical protein